MNVTARVTALRLRRPFISHRGVTTNVPTLFVEVESGGQHGVGAALLPPIDASLAARLEAPLAACRTRLAGRGPYEVEAVLAELREPPGAPVHAEQRALRTALDVALHDLLGRTAGLSLRDLFGLRSRVAPVTALTLGEGSTAALVERATAHRDWPVLKVKISSEIGLADVARVRDVYAGELWVDGNGHWAPADAVAAAETCAALGVTVLEQPVKAGCLDDLRMVHERSPVPVIADEDCASAEDVVRLAGCASGVNIKVHKLGGVRPALTAALLARDVGLRVMLGCRTESTVTVTATAQLAGLADYLDLDGHLDIADDPYRGLALTDGRVELPAASGTGVSAAGIGPADGDRTEG